MFYLNGYNYEVISKTSRHCTEAGEGNPQSWRAAAVEQRLRQRLCVADAKPIGVGQMTTISSTGAQRSGSGVRGGVIRLVGIWAHRLVAAWGRRSAINALHELDDRTLRDIGLARDQIDTALSELRRLR
jgi:uncharacterized protein YjiS (DUF1127 family)